MNTISKNKLVAGAAFLLLTGCILPGPWDYEPQDQPTFRGIWASAYAVADRPAENVCFERLLALDEGASDAFPFYDSASVGIEGVFSTGGATVILNPLYNTPNCFSGGASVHFKSGQSYTLTARFVWDSSGTRVVSVLRATAHIPAAFHISDTAVAPRLTLKGLAAAHGVDSTIARLQREVLLYHRRDSVFYIGGPSQLNNLSHYFHSVRSADVSGVLVAQRYDTTAGRPITTFDTFFGIKPDTGRFYYPGDHRRLILYPGTVNSNGYNVLDSIGVVNVWFWTGLNHLYFYGAEKSYMDYNSTNVGTDGNPKIQAITNVAGGRGFFSGMILDSFDVFIKTDTLTQVYPYSASRAFACRDKGWFESRDCAGWFHEFCTDNHWVRQDCRLEAIYTWGPVCGDPVARPTAPAGMCDSVAFYQTDTLLSVEALTRYCIDKNYPASFPGCTDMKKECETGSTGNGCQLILWKSCDLNYWKPAACVEGRKSYCKQYGATQKELCRTVNGN